MVVFKSRLPDVAPPPPGVGLTDYVLEHIPSHGDKVATIDSQTGETYTFRELQGHILSTASALSRRGLKKGDVVVILSINSHWYNVFQFGAIHIGCITYGLNLKYAIDDMARQLDICEPTILAFSPDLKEKAEILQKKYSGLKKVFTLGPATGEYESARDLAKEKIELPEIKRDPKKDLAYYFFSSGTTGFPKAVPATHYKVLYSNLRYKPHDVQLIPKDYVLAIISPMCHPLSSGMCVVNCFAQGNTIVYFPEYDFIKVLAGIEKYKVNQLIATSTIANSFAFDPIVDNYDLSSLKLFVFVAAPASGEVLRTMKKRLNILYIRGAYGMTETLSFSHMTKAWDTEFVPDKGKCGPLMPNTMCKIVHEDTGKELGKNEAGEILIKCEMVFDGYLKNPEINKTSFTEDGWYKTGDCGYVDDNEELIILDRIKDMIKVYAEQVAPSVLENVLVKHEAVAQVSVIAIPSNEMGEIPRAFVVLNKGMTVTEEELINFHDSKVADFQKLRGGLEFVNELPRNAMNKILRRELRDNYLKRNKQQ